MNPFLAAFALLLASPAAAQTPFRILEFAGGLDHPWGGAFLPDGRLLVSERPGRLRLVGRDGVVSAPLAGVPAVEARGQGGLLDIALAPISTPRGRSTSATPCWCRAVR